MINFVKKIPIYDSTNAPQHQPPNIPGGISFWVKTGKILATWKAGNSQHMIELQLLLKEIILGKSWLVDYDLLMRWEVTLLYRIN